MLHIHNCLSGSKIEVCNRSGTRVRVALFRPPGPVSQTPPRPTLIEVQTGEIHHDSVRFLIVYV
jgi:hypothetical protein